MNFWEKEITCASIACSAVWFLVLNGEFRFHPQWWCRSRRYHLRGCTAPNDWTGCAGACTWALLSDGWAPILQKLCWTECHALRNRPYLGWCLVVMQFLLLFCQWEYWLWILASHQWLVLTVVPSTWHWLRLSDYFLTSLCIRTHFSMTMHCAPTECVNMCEFQHLYTWSLQESFDIFCCALVQLLTRWGRGSAIIKVRQPEYSVQCCLVLAAYHLPVPNKQKSVESVWSVLIVNVIVIILSVINDHAPWQIYSVCWN